MNKIDRIINELFNSIENNNLAKVKEIISSEKEMLEQ